MEQQIYVVAHKEFILPTDDKMYIPLYVGKACCVDYDERHIKDNTGDNISYKNSLYNELTGVYWIWKNSTAEVVGMCHYRRYFVCVWGKILNVLFGKWISIDEKWLLNEQKIEKILNRYDAIVHNKTFFIKGSKKHLCIDNKSKKVQKDKLPENFLIICDEIFKRIHPEDCDIYDEVLNGKSSHLLNMIICTKELFDQYCEWLFPVLEEIEREIESKFSNELCDRYIGLFAERIMDVWIKKNGLKVKENFTVNTERVDLKMW